MSPWQENSVLKYAAACPSIAPAMTLDAVPASRCVSAGWPGTPTLRCGRGSCPVADVQGAHSFQRLTHHAGVQSLHSAGTHKHGTKAVHATAVAQACSPFHQACCSRPWVPPVGSPAPDTPHHHSLTHLLKLVHEQSPLLRSHAAGSSWREPGRQALSQQERAPQVGVEHPGGRLHSLAQLQQQGKDRSDALSIQGAGCAPWPSCSSRAKTGAMH